MSDEPTKREAHVPVVQAIAALSKLSDEEREARLERLVRQAAPPEFECEVCEDAYVIVSLDAKGQAHGRWCSCAVRKAQAAREEEEQADSFAFGPTAPDEPDDEFLFEAS